MHSAGPIHGGTTGRSEPIATADLQESAGLMRIAGPFLTAGLQEVNHVPMETVGRADSAAKGPGSPGTGTHGTGDAMKSRLWKAWKAAGRRCR